MAGLEMQHKTPTEATATTTTIGTAIESKSSWLDHLRNRTRTWSEHRSTRAYNRLDEERIQLNHDVATTQIEIKRVETQISSLQRAMGGSAELTAMHNAAVAPQTSHFLWIISGVVNGLLKLVFCIVFATLIFEAAPKLLKDALPVLVGTQFASTLVTCLVTAKYSTVGASIAGPDIIHALVLATMTGTVARNTNDPDEALATVLFLICFTGLCISLTWIVVAKYRLMVVIDFFPVAVVTGFLGCIGYKVLKEAAHIAVGPFWYYPSSGHFWLLLIPALPVGIPMFLLKRFHIGSPIVSMPFYIFAPMTVFFVSVAATQTPLDDLRANGWMFEEFETGRFWEQWSKLNFNLIQWNAVIETLPDTFILVIIITLDAFLKLSSTKDGLRCKMDMVTELYVLGFQNLISIACVGSVGYSQVKFNMINFAITNDAQERRPTIVVAVMCGILWFVGFPVINYLPRFFLAGLLIYAGLPFLEMVVQAYWRVTKKEFVTILIILIVNAVTGLVEATKSRTLLIAVGVGFLLSAFTFILQYAKTSVIRDSLLGQDYQSSVVRVYQEQKLVERLGIRYAIVELEGYIFFGSCNQIINWTKKLIAENNLQPNCKQLRYVTIDFKNVENIDYTGASSFRDIVDVLSDAGCDVLFSGCSKKIHGKLAQENVFNALGVLVFPDLDHASEYAEKSLLKRAAYVRAYWLMFDSFRKLHTQAVLKATYEIFEAVLGTEVGNRLWRYAEQIQYPAGAFITREGRFNHTLYLLQRGNVTTFRANDDESAGGSVQRVHTMGRGAFVNEECLFMDVPVQHSTIADTDCVVWAISRESMKKLEAHDPHLSAAILRNVLRMSSLVRNRLEREVSTINQGIHSTSENHTSWNEHAVSKTLGSRVLAEIRDMHEHHVANINDLDNDDDDHFSRVTGAGTHHAHHFHHVTGVIGLPPSNFPPSPHLSPRRTGDSSPTRDPLRSPRSPKSHVPKWTTIRPHLSTAQRQDAIECFLFHSVLDEEHLQNIQKGLWENLSANDNEGSRKRSGSAKATKVLSIVQKRRSFVNDTPRSFVNDTPNLLNTHDKHSESDMQTLLLNDPETPSLLRGASTFETIEGFDGVDSLSAVEGRRISLEELQRAVMDLGLFPTSTEIRLMHEKLGKNAQDRLDQSTTKFEDGADVKEFLAMVTVLSVTQMSKSTIEQLHQLFVDHAEKTMDGYHLWRDDLASLMRTLNHPEDEVELECLMKEWDLESKGCLDFDAFVSIVAHVLKSEELDELLEKDFLIFCGETNVEHPSLQQMHSAITATDIVRVARTCNIFIDHHLAEEMIFDADESGSGQLSLDHLIACIETVGAEEEDPGTGAGTGTTSDAGSINNGVGVGTSTITIREASNGSEVSAGGKSKSRHLLAEQKMQRKLNNSEFQIDNNSDTTSMAGGGRSPRSSPVSRPQPSMFNRNSPSLSPRSSPLTVNIVPLRK